METVCVKGHAYILKGRSVLFMLNTFRLRVRPTAGVGVSTSAPQVTPNTFPTPQPPNLQEFAERFPFFFFSDLSLSGCSFVQA